MATFNKILYPTDFSDNAKLAIPHLRELATRFGAQVHVLHVLETMLSPSDFAWTDFRTPELQAKREEGAKVGLSKLRDELELDPASTTLSVIDGHPSAEIVRYAEAHDIDLIVMSTHGHAGLSHFLLGSTAERIVRKAPCPVLTVGPRGQE